MAATENSTRERFRKLLRLLAGLEVDPIFEGKIDLSGVVQLTLLESEKVGADWEKWNDNHRMSWLRTALANNLTDEIRRVTTKGRDVRREIPLDRALDESSRRINRWLADQRPSPSSAFRQAEELLHLADALEKLTADQRQAIQLHHLRGMSLADTAQALGKSRDAAAGLIYRGMVALREKMEE